MRNAPMPKKYFPCSIILIMSLTCLSISYGSTNSSITDELQVYIFSFLPDSDAQKFPTLSKNHKLRFHQSGVGEFFRKNSKFAVLTENNTYLFLSEYLELPRRIPIISVKNIEHLFKTKTDLFYQIMSKSTPHTPDTIAAGLPSFYKETIIIDKLIDISPVFESREQRLAGIILDLLIWGEFISSWVCHEVSKVVESQIQEKIGKEAWEAFRVRVLDEVYMQVNEQTGSHFMAEIWTQIGKPVEDSVIVDLSYKFKHLQDWPHLNRDLTFFEFGSAYTDNRLNTALRPAIDYVFTLFQIESLAIRHSKAFKNIHSYLTNYLLKNGITDSQVLVDLNSIDQLEIPQDHNLIATQIKLIRKHLTSP